MEYSIFMGFSISITEGKQGVENISMYDAFPTDLTSWNQQPCITTFYIFITHGCIVL